MSADSDPVKFRTNSGPPEAISRDDPSSRSVRFVATNSAGWFAAHRYCFTGIARPSQVIEVNAASRQGSHSAPFPRALIEFFGKAFSDAGDIIADPFLGSGSTIAAAEARSRAGYGIEISPADGDVIRRRISNLCGGEPVLAPSGESMVDVAAKRGVAIEQVKNPGVRDARRIPQQRPAPFYGSRRKAAQQ